MNGYSGGTRTNRRQCSGMFITGICAAAWNIPIFLRKRPKMKEKHLYEYAIIRVVPIVEREEFLNVGLVLFSKKAKFIRVFYAIDEQKLRNFSADLKCNAFNPAAFPASTFGIESSMNTVRSGSSEHCRMASA